MLRFSTAGESHGESLVATVSGMPAGVTVEQEFVDRELWRRQKGYGRGGRMRIERDTAHILSGVRHGKTIGSPIAMVLANNDWKNWTEILPVEAGDASKHKAVASPRPGHADLAGSLKYDFPDARYVLERASARESAARVAAGAMAKLLLRALGVEIASHVIRVGGAELSRAAAHWRCSGAPRRWCSHWRSYSCASPPEPHWPAVRPEASQLWRLVRDTARQHSAPQRRRSP